MKFSARHIAVSGLALFPLLTCLPVLAQPDSNCEIVNLPAGSGFDFTEEISRWGSAESFDTSSAVFRVRSISVNRLPIFDETNPRENISIYRWANRVHIDTQPVVIEYQLLFVRGDVVTSQMLAESERILRERNYVADAKIRVLQQCGNMLDLEVVTREVWTLTPTLSFHASGGDNTSKIGLRDTNILGTGQSLSLVYDNETDRHSFGIAYENPNIRDLHRTVSVSAANKSDGYEYIARYALPFYSLNSRSAWNMEYNAKKEELTQYRLGEEFSEVKHKSTVAELSRGFSAGLRNGKVRRYTYGLRLEDHAYTPGPELPEPANFPAGISLTYPFLQLESIEDKFAVAYNISQIYRTEDLHIGSRLRASMGYDPSSSSRLIFDGEYTDTLIFEPRMLLQWGTDWYGRWNSDKGNWEDTVVNMAVNFHRGQTENRTLYMGLAATHAIHLNGSQQITLGGSNGLRGFKTHYLAGDGSVRFTIEERVYTNYQILQLIRVGYAGFVDVGRVFGNDEHGGGRIYKNVGIGLRLAPSKSSKGSVIHIDIAYPVGSVIRGTRSAQFVAEVKKSF